MNGGRWDKQGIIFSPKVNLSPNLGSEAMVPTPIHFKETGIIRIYYTSRDKEGLGHIYWFEVSDTNPCEIRNTSLKPVLSPGSPGHFDDSGVMATSILENEDGTFFLYYVGFEQLSKIRYRLLSGLATSEDEGNTFTRYSTQPILERTPDEPFFRGGPFVIKENDEYLMWYVGGKGWMDHNGSKSPIYSLKFLKSPNGKIWNTEPSLVLDPSNLGYAIGRPWLVKEGNNRRLFYSERKLEYMRYRLENKLLSTNNKVLESRMNFEIEPGPADFDSEEICYSSVININNTSYMFYNGNNLGQKGIALATLGHND